MAPVGGMASAGWVYGLLAALTRGPDFGTILDMAKTTQTFVTDDLDGSADAKEIKFSFNGIEYTIDLAEKNAAKFEKALAPFVAKATKVGGRRKVPSAGVKKTGKKAELADVRAWAKQNGYQVSERGRVPRSVVEAYDAAN